MKLSKTQIEVLKELGQEGSFLHFMPYMGSFRPTPYYFFTGNMKHVRFNTVSSLVEKGLAKDLSNDRVVISEEGKKMLEEETK
jgi:hypothetical protein